MSGLVPLWGGGGGGGAGGTQAITLVASLVASEAISALRVIKAFNGAIQVADASVSVDAGKAIGISLNAVVAGGDLQYQYAGPLANTGWAWVEGPIFIGAGGQLTQSTVGLAFIQRVGTALSNTEILIDLDDPIIGV